MRNECMRAAQALLGKHDFSAFRAAGCQASTAVRTIVHIAVFRRGDWLTLEVTANAFLQHMVRNIAGTLADVGLGEQSVEWVDQVLESRDRKAGGIAAPPHGLTLVSVEYPDGVRYSRARYLLAVVWRSGYHVEMSWFEKLMPSRISTESRYEVGARGRLDQVPGLRRTTLPK